MKKFILSLFSVALIFGFVNGPVQVGAASKTPELVEPAAVYYKTVDKVKAYSLSASIDPTYYYNENGYSGTLRLQSTRNAGDHILAYYVGTVTCSGSCAIPY